MKKVLSVCLAILLAFGVLPAISAVSLAGETPALHFTENGSNSYTLSSCSNAVGAFTVPQEYNGKPVTAVGEEAFVLCKELTEITLPGSIHTIGRFAFSGCEKLSVIHVGDGVRSIGADAFTGTLFSETEANWTDGALYLESYLIKTKSDLLKTAYSVKAGTTVIAGSAFAHNSRLAKITLPASLKAVGEMAFFYCTALTAPVLPDSVSFIGYSAFEGCTALENITLPAKLTILNTRVLRNCVKLKALTIPAGVTAINEEALAGCSALTTLSVGNGVQKIAARAFSDCASLTHIETGNSIFCMEEDAFRNTAYYHNAANWKDGVLYLGSYLLKADAAKLSKTVRVKAGTRCIAAAAFSGCSALTGLSLPDSVTAVGERAFSGTAYYHNAANWENDILYAGKCALASRNASAVVVKEGTVCIADGCFSPDDGTERALSWVYLPQSVTTIGEKAFYDCAFGSAVTIPAGTSYLGDKAFGYGFVYDEPDNAKEYRIPVTLRGMKNSPAAQYAKANGLSFLGKCTTCTYGSMHTAAEATYEEVGVREKVCTVCGDAILTIIPMKKLASVQLVSVKNAVAGVQIRWSRVAGATGYRVYRKTPGDKSWQRIATVAAQTMYNDGTAKSGNSFVYTVKAVNARQSGGYDRTGLTIRFLGAPKLLSVTEKTDGNVLKWGRVAGAKSYYVYRKAGDAESWTRIAVLKSSTANAYKDTKVKNAVLYTYTVRACNGADAGSFYPGISAVYLAAPRLKSAVNEVGGIRVIWSKTAGAEGYLLYRKASSEKQFTKIAVLTGADAVSYTDEAAKSGTVYTYTVKAYSALSRSGFYPGIAVTCVARVVVKSCVSKQAKCASIRWEPVAGASSYVIFALNKNKEYVKVMTVDGSKTAAQIGNLIPGKTYRFCVKAYNGKTAGKGSALASVQISR